MTPLGMSNEPSSPLADPQQALRIPLGAASPLWFMFAGVASAGVAYWWMTRWTRPQNLEAMFGAVAPVTPLFPALSEIEAEVAATLPPIGGESGPFAGAAIAAPLETAHVVEEVTHAAEPEPEVAAAPIDVAPVEVAPIEAAVETTPVEVAEAAEEAAQSTMEAAAEALAEAAPEPIAAVDEPAIVEPTPSDVALKALKSPAAGRRSGSRSRKGSSRRS